MNTFSASQQPSNTFAKNTRESLNGIYDHDMFHVSRTLKTKTVIVFDLLYMKILRKKLYRGGLIGRWLISGGLATPRLNLNPSRADFNSNRSLDKSLHDSDIVNTSPR